MTTNERFNAWRYKHFHARQGNYYSPFNHGLVKNFINFFCTTSEHQRKLNLDKKEKFIV